MRGSKYTYGNPMCGLRIRTESIRCLERARAGMRMADKLVTVGYAGVGNKSKFDSWANVLKNLPSGTYEIYCHPAYPDETLRHWSYYRNERAEELAILRNKELRNAALAAGVQIVSFDAI